jgi:catechol 2,3-dioxygenase-like lactoylglutathione lyase family enzyme
MALKRMDNVGIVVDDLGGTIDFFRELGLELEGRAMIEGEWAGRVTGLGDQRVEIAMIRMPDGHGRLELSRFLTPPAVADHRNAPVNALGYLRAIFAVDDIDETLERLREQGAQLVGEVVQYKDAYRLCYIRGPEGLLIGLAQELILGQNEHVGETAAFSYRVDRRQCASNLQPSVPTVELAPYGTKTGRIQTVKQFKGIFVEVSRRPDLRSQVQIRSRGGIVHRPSG